MIAKRAIFLTVLTFLVEDRHAVLNAAIITGTQAVDLLFICILMPWSARSVDWANIFSGLITLCSYGFILSMTMIADEDLLPTWGELGGQRFGVNDLTAFLLVLAGTGILLLNFLACVLEHLLEALFKCMDTRGAAMAAAEDIAKQSQEDEAVEKDTMVGGGRAQSTVSVDFVHSPQLSPRNSEGAHIEVSVGPVLLPADLASFQGEFPGVTASDPAKREEQLRARAEELAMLRREKELARVARASKRLGWKDKQRSGDFGAMGHAASLGSDGTYQSSPVRQGTVSVPEDGVRLVYCSFPLASLLLCLHPGGFSIAVC